MPEFASYYINFLWSVLQNIGDFFYRIGYAFYKIFAFDIPGYFVELSKHIGSFDALGWIMLIITFLVNLAILFFFLYWVFQLFRRYVFFRSKEVEKDKLMEEIAVLKLEAEELVKEKKKIFALKINGRYFEGEPESLPQNMALPAPSVDSSVSETARKSRFTKLILLDERYAKNPNIVHMEEADMLPLDKLVDRFVNFSASQLKLFYKHDIIRLYFSAMASSKIIILEGISGTGKTSLPYAMGKFFNNNAAIVSVQPSWRERAELLGYFNEFTKKFNETDFLESLYETTLREDPCMIVLDEMNLARIEYYFAEFLSIMEMPDIAQWTIDLVPNSLPEDPKNIVYGKLLVPQNVWFVGTANNDDSTFSITDKVYDRAIALELNEKAKYFDAELTENVNCSYRYLDSLFEQAQKTYPVSDELLSKLTAIDDFIQTKFKIGFGNRVLKQLKLFVPVYVACGGKELEGVDFMLSSKILRKFTSLNLPFLRKELSELSSQLDKTFGKNSFRYSQEYIKVLQKM